MKLMRHPQVKGVTYLGLQPFQYEEREKLNPGWYRLFYPGQGEPGPKFSYRAKKADIGRVSFSENPDFARVLTEFEKTINAKEWFQKLGASYRRGFILYGPPGTGKTTLQQEICNFMIEKHSAMVIDMQQVSYESLELAKQMIEGYRAIHPEQVFIVSMGDLNAGMFNNQTLDALRTSLEMSSSAPLFWFATTNEFDSLDKSIVSRPGRFDTRILIERLPHGVVKSLCELNFIGEFTEEIYKNKHVTPALIREIAIRTRCFGVDCQTAIKAVNKEFDQGLIQEPSAPSPAKSGLKKLLTATKVAIPKDATPADQAGDPEPTEAPLAVAPA